MNIARMRGNRGREETVDARRDIFGGSWCRGRRIGSAGIHGGDGHNDRSEGYSSDGDFNWGISRRKLMHTMMPREAGFVSQSGLGCSINRNFGVIRNSAVQTLTGVCYSRR